MNLPEHLAQVLGIDPDAPAVEYLGEWTTWGQLATVAASVKSLIASSGVEGPVAVGVLLANRPEIVGAALGVLLGGNCIVTINPHQGDAGVGSDLRDLRPAVIIGAETEWNRSAVVAAASDLGLAGISVAVGEGGGAHCVDGLARTEAADYRKAEPGVAVEMLTSGTTGPPKRVPLYYSAFERTIAAAGQHYRNGGPSQDGVRLRSGVALVTSPLVHMSGIFRMLLNICEGRRIALLDRFRVPEWIELVVRHRPRAVSLVPTALAMVYDAEVDPAVFESVEVVTSGSAALDPGLQGRFEKRYGVAVLPSYGATEFAGGVAGWTLPLHREWIARKRGSVGRPQPGRKVRAVDATTGSECEHGTQGILEVGSEDGDEWVRTTDLGRVDDDGFVWIDGRTDDAILRGGFKVFPTEVADVLRGHPAVLDAGVVGIPDSRLGAVPVAAVELRPGYHVDDAELLAFAGEHLAAYKVPRHLLIAAELPRTPSLKVSGPGVRSLVEAELAAGETETKRSVD